MTNSVLLFTILMLFALPNSVEATVFLVRHDNICCQMSAQALRNSVQCTHPDQVYVLLDRCGVCTHGKCRVEWYCVCPQYFLSSQYHQGMCEKAYGAPWPLSASKSDKQCEKQLVPNMPSSFSVLQQQLIINHQPTTSLSPSRALLQESSSILAMKEKLNSFQSPSANPGTIISSFKAFPSLSPSSSPTATISAAYSRKSAYHKKEIAEPSLLPFTTEPETDSLMNSQQDNRGSAENGGTASAWEIVGAVTGVIGAIAAILCPVWTWRMGRRQTPN